MAKRAEKYRKNGYVKLGKVEIVGLKMRPDGRYYASAHPSKTFGKDLAAAVYRFRQWLASSQTERVVLYERRPPSEAVKQSWAELGETVTEVSFGHAPPADAFWAKVRALILADPQNAAERTGIPQIARLDRLQPAPDALTCADVVEQYLAKPLTDNEKTQVKNQWQEFCEITKAQTVDDLTRPAVARYESHYRSMIAAGKIAQKTVKNRWHRIKSIINFVVDRVDDNQRQQVERAQVICRSLLKPARSQANHKPKPISRAHLNALLAAADPRMTVAILCGVNLGLYAKEVSCLTLAEFDLANKTFDSRRIKTGGTPRMGMLWDRTIEAIKAIKPKETLFDHFPVAEIFRQFVALRKIAGVPKSVTFSCLRDGTDTRATESGASDRQCKLLMGHTLGIAAHYAQVSPQITHKATDYIERYYFPTKKGA